VEEDIVRKLRDAFAKGVESEERVVYVLVEIRKLLEKRHEAESYPALKFYCDWAVHPWLDAAGAARIVKRFDRFEELSHTGAFEPGQRVSAEDSRLLEDFRHTLELTKFQQQLSSYLGQLGLDEIPTENWEWWLMFLRQYASVIQDCPLLCENSGLCFVDKVVARVMKVKQSEIECAFVVEWSWLSKQTGDVKAYCMYF
jgi:hypothetical protein